MASSNLSGTVAARILALQSRPATSLSSGGSSARNFPRKQRSLGDLVGQVDGANELLEARARLKHVGYSRKSPIQEDETKAEPQAPAAIRRRRTNSSVLEELDDLLDTAIGEHTIPISTTTDSFETADDTIPDWPLPRAQSFTSKSPSKYASRHSSIAAQRRQSRRRHSRTNSSGAVRSATSHRARGQSIDSNRPRSSTDTDVGAYHSLLSEAENELIKIEVPKHLQNSKSPIKQRAALFEKLSQHEASRVHEIPHIHDTRNPIRVKRMWPPNQEENKRDAAPVEVVQSLEEHHLKFHHGRNEGLAKNNPDSPPRSSSPEKTRTSHVPPIPLTLPQLVSLRSRSPPDITAPTKQSSDTVLTTATSKPGELTDKRKSSYHRPLKWDIFRKLPDVSVKGSTFVAHADPDHHASALKAHENQHRVHNLLVAAQDAIKKYPSELKNDKQAEIQSTPPRRAVPGTLTDTPTGSSTTEKEVASPPYATPTGTATHNTARGRRRLQDVEVVSQSQAGENDSTYKLEQRFALSRSRSRGGGVRVQVEIRSPKASPERCGEHTVIVTANVEPIKDEDRESGDGD